MHFIGIDIGTSSICGVVYHPSTQSVISVTKENCANISSPDNWENYKYCMGYSPRIPDPI